MGVGAWSIFKSKIERRVKVAIAWILGAQIATVQMVFGMAIVGGAGSGDFRTDLRVAATAAERQDRWIKIAYSVGIRIWVISWASGVVLGSLA